MKNSFLIIVLALSTFTLFSFYQAFDLKASVARGKTVYEAQCITCHMSEGEGLEGVYPSLAKSDHLTDKDRLVKIVLKGMRGPIKVKDVDYDGEMVALVLNDQETSDVLNYVRNSWGNKGEPIQPAAIQPALKTTSKDYKPY